MKRAIEAVGEVVCKRLGVGKPDVWKPFEDGIVDGLEAVLALLPPELADAVRAHLEHPK